MSFLCGTRGLVVLICAVLTLYMVSSCSKGSGGDGYQPVDVSTLSPKDQMFRYIDTGEASELDSLLKANPDLVNFVDDVDYRTPLHFAAALGNQKIVNVLLDNGADPLAEDINNLTPADAARQEAHVGLAQKLVEAAEKAAAE